MKIIRDVSYGTDPLQKMDIALPEVTPVGTVMLIHGGAWVEGDKINGYTESVMDFLTKEGLIAATMNYRLTNKNININHMLDDIKNALDCLYDKTDEIESRSERVMLIGWSAGGHLAELYSYTRTEDAKLKVKAVCGYSGISDISDPGLCINNPLSDIINRPMFGVVSDLIAHDITEENIRDCAALLLKYSPVTYAAKAVPTLICHSEIDQYVNYKTARKLEELLKEKSIDNFFIDFPRSGHDLGFDPDSLKESYEKILEFANKYVAK